MMKSLMQAGLVILALAPPAAAQSVPDPTGAWLRNNGTVQIAVTRCGTSYCAVNTWVKRPDGPEKIGDKIILNMKAFPNGKFKGEGYDLRRHLTYRLSVTLQGDQMKTSGCILFGFICKSTSWHRVG